MRCSRFYSHPQVTQVVGFISLGTAACGVPRVSAAPRRGGLWAACDVRIDQTIWPETLRIAIEAIESARFLSAEQKRDILYNNAARSTADACASIR
jgi:hypothetical protein